MHPSLPQYPQQQVFSSPPRQRTPFWHCAAGVGVWYLAVVIGFGAAELREPSGDNRWLGVLVAGAIAWLLTTSAMWGVLRLSGWRVKPWALILLALPFGWAIYTVLSYLVLAVALYVVSHS